MRLYLGTNEPSWLRYADMRLCVSRRRLIRLKRALPRAVTPWMLDSGGFTELQRYGGWTLTAAEYARLMRRYADEIGLMEWCAPQDWMCEPAIIGGGTSGGQHFAGTGLSVSAHIDLTVGNYVELRTIDASLPLKPVVQGYRRDDYFRCIDRYAAAGVDLFSMDLVGLGSVCRRQHTAEIEGIVAELAMAGLRLHGFGVKIQGLAAYGPDLVSCDSQSWSASGRRLPGCGTGRHQSEANCYAFARRWGARLTSARAEQPSLWSPALP